MTTPSTPSKTVRTAGTLIVAGSVVQLIAAFLPNPIVFMATGLARLQAIASDVTGWYLQAVLFPVAFAIVTAGLVLLARWQSQQPARALALMAAALGALSTLLWLPISLARIQMGLDIQNLIRQATAGATPDINSTTFLPYSAAALLMVVLAGASLYVGRLRRRTGIAAMALGALGLAGYVISGDWPPFITYGFTLVIGIGLRASRGA